MFSLNLLPAALELEVRSVALLHPPKIQSHNAEYMQICCKFEGTDTALPSHLEGTVAFCGAYANNHDYFFHACAFIIRLNNPIYASIMVLFRLDNKKENSFF